MTNGGNTEEELIFNFEFLRQHGIKLLQQLSGNIWTDYNLHDPGVTILEHLCFAFTDLAFRTNFPLQDILAAENGEIEAIKNSFYSARKMLSSNAVSVKDKRKYIIDAVPEIANIFIEPVSSHFAGVYKTIIRIHKDFNPEISRVDDWDFPSDGLASIDEIKNTVINKLIATRNLCEDFGEITALKPEPVEMLASVFIESNAVAEEVLAQIYLNVEGMLTHTIKYATEKDLKNKGLSTEDIYRGPQLEKGIITDDELKNLTVIIDPVQFIKTILSVPGVVNIKNFQLKVGDNTPGTNHYHIQEGNYAYLLYKPGNISLYKSNNKQEIRENQYKNRYYRTKQVAQKDFIASVYRNEATSPLRGKWRDLKNYHSIQEYFPVAYGLKKNGLPDNADAERKAAVKQLRGYLMLFEQTLLNYLAQLGNISNFFSADLHSQEARTTMYVQPPFNLPDADDIIRSVIANSADGADNTYMEMLRNYVETDNAYVKKKKQVFDHLLARFNLTPGDLPVSKYEQCYGNELTGRTDVRLRWKSALLTNIQEISYYKFRAFDYTGRDNSLPANAGFKKNMYHFLNIAPPYDKSLTAGFSNNSFRIIPQARVPVRSEEREGPVPYQLRFNPRNQRTHEVIDDHLHHGLFANQTIAVFIIGTDKKNYKLLPDPVNPERVVVAMRSNESRDTWRIISRHAQYAEAESLVARLVQQFRRVSIESEGFHMVEHVLLRPAVNDPVFKHVLVDETGKKILWQNDLAGFDESRQHLNDLLQSIAQSDPHPSVYLLREIFAGWDAVVEYKNGDLKNYATVSADDALLQEVFNGLRASGNKSFRCMVKQSAGFYVDQDFFSNKISFVFPLWPARFQDAAFRTYAQNFMAGSCPVYIRSHFLWLNIGRMIDVEAVYFPWVESLRGNDMLSKKQLSTALVQLIADERYIVRTNIEDE